MSRHVFGAGSPRAESPSERPPTTRNSARPGLGVNGSTKGKPERSKSGSPGVFASIGLASPSLRLHFLEETLFLHPAVASDQPADDPSVSGSVVLWLPKAKQLKGLTVRLRGKMDISWPDGRPHESATVLDKVVSLFDVDTMLEKGEHTFHFEIIVPSSTATYERCQHGRVRHFVTAKAKGIGNLGGDIVSEEKIVFLFVNPGGAGASEPPPALQHNIEGMVDEIGVNQDVLCSVAQPYTACLHSQHIMVGGLLLFRFHLISPPTDMLIYSFKVKINQHYTLRSPNDGHTFTPPIDQRLAIILDSVHAPNFGVVEGNAGGSERVASQTPQTGPFKVVPAGTSYELSHIGRLPNDNVIRPSTQPGTETGITITHEMVVEMTYRAGPLEELEKKKGKETPKDRRKLVLTRAVDIYSCCSFVDSLTLPTYSYVDPYPPSETHVPPCVCGFSLKEMVKYHGQTLLRETGETGVTYAQVFKDESGPSTPTPLSPRSDRGRQLGHDTMLSATRAELG